MFHEPKCVLRSHNFASPSTPQLSMRVKRPISGRWLGRAAAVVLLGMVSSSLAAAVTFDESASGDLSNSGFVPSSLSLTVGDNLISGTTGRDVAGVVDRDYFTFTVAPNQTLAAITVLSGTTAIGTNALSFIGVQSGNQVTVSPTSGTASGLLGWTHYGAGDIGANILDNMSVPAAGSTGFTPPLGSGSYAFWVQDTGTGTASYRFNFIVASVPEPSTWAMMLIGFVAIGYRFRSSRNAARTALRQV